MLSKNGDEAIAVRRLNEMNHLVNDNVFEEVKGNAGSVCRCFQFCQFQK